MFCNKCGAVVVGKFCSCCGEPVRSQKEELYAAENRMRQEFCDSCAKAKDGCADYAPAMVFLAQACWDAAVSKYKKEPGDTVSFIEAENSLGKAKCAARELFNKLKDF